MTAPTSLPAAEPVGGPVWTVAAVAARLDVSPSTLRSWSLRYGLDPRGHLAGRHRRYTGDDVAELDTVRRLVDQGVTLPAAAAMVRGHHPVTHPSSSEPVAVPARVVHTLIDAARDLDPVAAGAIVTACLARCGVETTWDQLCRPALAALDNPVLDRPAADGGSTGPDSCIDAELVLSRAVSTSLRRLPTPSAPPGARRVLLACAEGEHHTLALEALCAAATVERGLDARLLGASVNDQVLSTAVAILRPAVVIVWAQVAATAAPNIVNTLAAGTAPVVTAGPGWEHAELDPRVVRVTSLRTGLNVAGRDLDRAGTI